MSEQHDDHIWLTVLGEGWAIRRIEGPVFYLWRGYYPDLQFLTVEITEPDWEAYCEAAMTLLHKKGPLQGGPKQFTKDRTRQ